jgi:hypothetical protein
MQGELWFKKLAYRVRIRKFNDAPHVPDGAWMFTQYPVNSLPVQRYTLGSVLFSITAADAVEARAAKPMIAEILQNDFISTVFIELEENVGVVNWWR